MFGKHPRTLLTRHTERKTNKKCEIQPMHLLPAGLNTVHLAGGGQRSGAMKQRRILNPITCATSSMQSFPANGAVTHTLHMAIYP
nr:MAG TPA: hypothetical protein [Caudoviricetes sp.]